MSELDIEAIEKAREKWCTQCGPEGLCISCLELEMNYVIALKAEVKALCARVREMEGDSQWSKSRPTEAGWYMVRGPSFRICILVSDIAGEIYPDLPYRWDTFDGCEFCPVNWMDHKEGAQT